MAWRGLGAGEMVPPGLRVTTTPMASGADIPDLGPALTVMGTAVLHQGRIKPTALPSAGQIAPKI